MSPIFYQDPRERALDILQFIYEAWASSWQETLAKLGKLNLPEAVLHRLNFYDNEQRHSIVSCLARLLVTWESADKAGFSSAVSALAHELRPSFASLGAEEGIILEPTQLSLLRRYLSRISGILKSSIAELAALPAPADHVQNTSSAQNSANLSQPTKPLDFTAAESLLRERLGLSFFDFLEFSEEPTFGNGYFPALLQDSIDQGF